MSSETKKWLIIWVSLMTAMIPVVLYVAAHKQYWVAFYIIGGVTIVVSRIIFWVRWRRQRLARRQAP